MLGEVAEGHSYAEKQKGTEFKVDVHKFAKGTPGACRGGDTAKIAYTGKFADGSVFDSTDKSNFGMPMKFSSDPDKSSHVLTMPSFRCASVSQPPSPAQQAWLTASKVQAQCHQTPTSFSISMSSTARPLIDHPYCFFSPREEEHKRLSLFKSSP